MTHSKNTKMAKHRKMPAASIGFAIVALLAVPADLSAQQAPAGSGDVKLVKEADFTKVRPKLIAKGWKPVVTEEMVGDTPRNQFGGAEAMYQAGYIEVEGCTEGRVYCTFNYRRGKKCLQITTRGEYGKFQGRQWPVIQAWSNECYQP